MQNILRMYSIIYCIYMICEVCITVIFNWVHFIIYPVLCDETPVTWLQLPRHRAVSAAVRGDPVTSTSANMTWPYANFRFLPTQQICYFIYEKSNSGILFLLINTENVIVFILFWFNTLAW